MTRRLAAACLAAGILAGCGGEGAGPPPTEGAEAGLTRLERIGKHLFFDTSLSNPRGQACGSCHDPATGFAGNFGSAAGVPLAADGATLGLRNTPTAAYARFAPAFSILATATGPVARGGQFLDGRAADLEAQAAVPFFSAGEMNLASPLELLARIAAGPDAPLWMEEFGADVFSRPEDAVGHATRAIAAFERTAELAAFSSKLDQVLAGAAVLSDAEREGLALFMDPQAGGCARCHAFVQDSRLATDRLFTDFTYRVLAPPRNPRIPANAVATFFDLGLCGPRRERVAEDRLCGAFKVPTLRNVTKRAAYMHNGSIATLREAVAFHLTRDATPARWYGAPGVPDDLPTAFRSNVEPMTSRVDERGLDAIVAFLGALEDGYGPSRAQDGR